MSPRRAFWKWSAIGLLTGVFLLWVQALAVGGPGGLLQVGETSDLRPLIEGQLGEIPLAAGPGHDGQIFYAIGLDLDGNEVGPLLDHASYRYRRILYPLLASGFGLLDGWALLGGMATIGILSMAASAGIVASMAARAGRSELLALSVVLNPGVWLSVQLLTSDAMAVALMLTGLWAVTARRQALSSAGFALSGLAKDVVLATPLAFGLRRRDWRLIVVPAGALIAWTAVLTLRFGEGLTSRGNIGWPFMGMLEASSTWQALGVVEWFYLAFALGAVTSGTVLAMRRSWLRWPIIAWVALAVVSSDWVWDLGNNAARAFGPIVILATLSLTHATAEEAVSGESRSLA